LAAKAVHFEGAIEEIPMTGHESTLVGTCLERFLHDLWFWVAHRGAQSQIEQRRYPNGLKSSVA
jgi:hypothetical protein